MKTWRLGCRARRALGGRGALRHAWAVVVVGSLFLHREAEILAMTIMWGAKFALMSALLAWEERRLPEEKRARAWPPATRLLACAIFQELALPVHFWRTRRTAVGLGLGILWAVALVVAGALAFEAVAFVMGVPT